MAKHYSTVAAVDIALYLLVHPVVISGLEIDCKT